MQSDSSEIGNVALLGFLGSALRRVKALSGELNKQSLLKSGGHEANAAGIFAETSSPETTFVKPGHRGGAFFSEAKRTTTSKPKPIAAYQIPREIYTDAEVRREVFDEQNGPEKMRSLAQAEKDLLTFRDREHVMEACLTGGRMHPDGLSDLEIREKCRQMKEMLPTAAEAFQAEMQRFHDDVDDRYKIPTTRSTVGNLVEECSKTADSGMVDAFSAAPGAGERYRNACAELKDALKKVDIAVQQNWEGTYVPRATVGAPLHQAQPGATVDVPHHVSSDASI